MLSKRGIKNDTFQATSNIHDNTSKQFREDTWVSVHDPDKCLRGTEDAARELIEKLEELFERNTMIEKELRENKYIMVD